MTDRICASPICGRVLVRREGERPRSFRQRKCCNYTCGIYAAHVTRNHNSVCPVCTTRQRRRSPEGRLYATCSDPACIAAAPKYAPKHESVEFHWPVITGEIDWHGEFAKHNHDPGDGGRFVLKPPERYSYSSSSAAWLIGGDAA